MISNHSVVRRSSPWKRWKYLTILHHHHHFDNDNISRPFQGPLVACLYNIWKNREKCSSAILCGLTANKKAQQRQLQRERANPCHVSRRRRTVDIHDVSSPFAVCLYKRILPCGYIWQQQIYSDCLVRWWRCGQLHSIIRVNWRFEQSARFLVAFSFFFGE